MKKHIIVYSHGFGVRKDDRGLFSDVAASLPNIEHVMFDYNQVAEAANTLTVASLTDQAKKLQQVVADTQANNPDAVIDLIGHSQGCFVAAIAQPKGIRKAIFTAPPPDADIEDKIRRWKVRYGTQFTTEGTSYLERKDGSTTIVPREYWTSLKNLNAQELYSTFAESTNFTIITATQDEVLGEVVFGKLSSKIKVIEIATGHNFEGEGRQKLVDVITQEVQYVSSQRIVIVNNQDEMIGHKERHSLEQGDIYRVAALWITNSQGDILLAQRKFTKSHDPGKWGPAVAGTVDEGETYDSNIVKEAEEEVGLKDIKPTLGPKRRIRDQYNYFCQWYTLKIDKPAEDFVIQEDEVERIKWFGREEFKEELRLHADKYLKGLDWVAETL